MASWIRALWQGPTASRAGDDALRTSARLEWLLFGGLLT
jgi:hypothetical protein